MQRSTAKILTTHVGSLPGRGEIYAAGRTPAANDIRTIVAAQRDTGIDIINEGEFTKGGDWLSFIDGRLGGFTSAPATEAIMGVVPKAKAGVGSAVNDATRLLGGTLGVAVIGSVYASLYASRLTGALPGVLSASVVRTAHASVGAALTVAGKLTHAGHPLLASAIHNSANSAFFQGFHAANYVAAGIAAAGAVMAYSFVLTYLLALLLKVVIGIRVPEEEEVLGIDQQTHAETAYELGGGIGGGSGTPSLPSGAARPSSVEVS